MTMQLVNPVAVILRDIDDKRIHREQVATVYAELIRQNAADGTDFPWPEINAAILKRWSPSGLVWIKERAWKISGVVLV
jgi:hypothetical protein